MVARRFYLDGWSQVRIARELGVDSSTVSRYLARARERGIVHIEIRRPVSVMDELSRRIADQFGLARAVVVPARDDPLDSVASATAEFLEHNLRSGLRLGVSWGRTLASVASRLRPGRISGLTIAPLAGGLDDTAPGIQSHDLVRALAACYPGSNVRYLHAPAIVDTVTIRTAILSDRRVKEALAAAADSELALVGVGEMGEESTLVSGGHVSRSDRSELVTMGAVGNMNTRFFDRAGQPVGEIGERTVGVTWSELRAIPMVVAAAAGLEKRAAIAGAVRSGCVDVLVTDSDVANYLVRQSPEHGQYSGT